MYDTEISGNKKGSSEHGQVFLMTQTPNSSVLDSLGSSDPILICTPYIQTGIKSYHPYQGSGDNASKTAHKRSYQKRFAPKTLFNGSYQSSQKNKETKHKVVLLLLLLVGISSQFVTPYISS
jgi:hypothetical protein